MSVTCVVFISGHDIHLHWPLSVWVNMNMSTTNYVTGKNSQFQKCYVNIIPHSIQDMWGFIQTAYITSHNGWNYATLNASDKRNTHTKTNASWWAWPELSREGQGQVFPNMTSFRGRFYQCSQLHSGLINKCLTSSCLMSSPASSSLWQAQ